MKKGTLVAITISLSLIVGGGLIAVAAYFIGGGNIGFYHRSERFAQQTTVFSGEMHSERREFSGVTAIDIDADYADIALYTGAAGSSVVVEYHYYERQQISCEMSGGTLVYKSRQRDAGFNLTRSGSLQYPSVSVTYPAGEELEQVTLHTNLGDIKMSDLAVKTRLKASSNLGDVDMKNTAAETIEILGNMGDFYCDGLTAASFTSDSRSGSTDVNNSRLGEASFTASLGDITGTGLSTSGLKVSSSSGDIELAGELHGKTTVKSSLGGVALTLGLPREDCFLDLHANLGDIEVNGREGGSQVYENDESAPNSIVVKSNMGDIDVDF